jgi:hypothetical protein
MYDSHTHFTTQYDNAKGIYTFAEERFASVQSWRSEFRPHLRNLLGLDTISGKDDPIFPLSEAKHAFTMLKKIYKAAGVPDNCELYIGH